MSVTNYRLPTSTGFVFMDISDGWVRTIGSQTVTAAPATDHNQVVLSVIGTPVYTVRARDYCQALFSNLLAGQGAGRVASSVFGGWCIARLEELGVAIATIMNDVSRFSDN